jgi:glycosyltransferase involved in cell wall biosynthesis
LSERVLVIAPQPFYQDRGTPIAVRLVLEALSQLGREVDVATFPLGRPVYIPHVRYYRAANPLGLRSVPIGFSLRKLALDACLAPRVVERLRRRHYDAIHAVEEAAFLALALARGRMPVVYDMASSIPEQLAGRRGFRSRPVRALCRRLERWALERSDVVVCSAGLLDHVRSVAPRTRARVWRFPSEAPRPAPEEVSAIREALALPERARVVLYAGSFAAYQGLPLLLDAAPRVLAEVPDAFFVLVGATRDEDLEAARRRLPPLVAGRVRLVSRVPRESLPAFLAGADVLVSPRLHGHNCPLKVFDYLASGRPVVATDVPAHRCTLDASRAVLVETSSDGLAKGIVGLLGDPDRARRLAAAGSAYARRELGWSRFVGEIDDLYREAASSHRRPKP